MNNILEVLNELCYKCPQETYSKCHTGSAPGFKCPHVIQLNGIQVDSCAGDIKIHNGDEYLDDSTVILHGAKVTRHDPDKCEIDIEFDSITVIKE